MHLADAPAADARISSVWEGNGRLAPSYAQYLVDKPSGIVRIQIRDAQTNELIREIPEEEVARAAEAIRAYLLALQTRRTQPGEES